MNYEAEFQESLHRLNSDWALTNLEIDPYWPKWDSPWWHMLLLHEMGETKRIPEQVIKTYVSALNRVPVQIFPIHPKDMPAGIDPYRHCPCHCQLGNVYQVLSAWGVDVDKELPWIRPWFLRYQMNDGGLNCDSEAYLVKDETPSSMVGTIAVFEAILLYTPRAWTAEEKVFLDKGAHFLMGRKLMHGSSTKHNAAEQTSAEKWLKPCFPRFYFYDILRGLNALLAWAEKKDQDIPTEAVRDVVTYLNKRFPDGFVKNERLAYEGSGTLKQSSTNEWTWHPNQASVFPLLTKLSAMGEVSPFLSRQWQQIKSRLDNHSNLRGLL